MFESIERLYTLADEINESILGINFDIRIKDNEIFFEYRIYCGFELIKDEDFRHNACDRETNFESFQKDIDDLTLFFEEYIDG